MPIETHSAKYVRFDKSHLWKEVMAWRAGTGVPEALGWSKPCDRSFAEWVTDEINKLFGIAER